MCLDSLPRANDSCWFLLQMSVILFSVPFCDSLVVSLGALAYRPLFVPFASSDPLMLSRNLTAAAFSGWLWSIRAIRGSWVWSTLSYVNDRVPDVCALGQRSWFYKTITLFLSFVQIKMDAGQGEFKFDQQALKLSYEPPASPGEVPPQASIQIMDKGRALTVLHPPIARFPCLGCVYSRERGCLWHLRFQSHTPCLRGLSAEHHPRIS